MFFPFKVIFQILHHWSQSVGLQAHSFHTNTVANMLGLLVNQSIFTSLHLHVFTAAVLHREDINQWHK